MSFPDASRIRRPLRITLDPAARKMAERLAGSETLSRWIEGLIRAEGDRDRRRQKEQAPVASNDRGPKRN